MGSVRGPRLGGDFDRGGERVAALGKVQLAIDCAAGACVRRSSRGPCRSGWPQRCGRRGTRDVDGDPCRRLLQPMQREAGDVGCRRLRQDQPWLSTTRRSSGGSGPQQASVWTHQVKPSSSSSVAGACEPAQQGLGEVAGRALPAVGLLARERRLEDRRLPRLGFALAFGLEYRTGRIRRTSSRTVVVATRQASTKKHWRRRRRPGRGRCGAW